MRTQPCAAPAVAPANKPVEKVKFKTAYTGTGHLKKIADIMAVASPGLRANAYSLSFPSSTTLALKNEGIITSVAVGRKRPLDESQVTKLSMKRPSKDFRVVNAAVGGVTTKPHVVLGPKVQCIVDLMNTLPEDQDEARLTELFYKCYNALNQKPGTYEHFVVIPGNIGTKMDNAVICEDGVKDRLGDLSRFLCKDSTGGEGQKALSRVAMLPTCLDDFSTLGEAMRNGPVYKDTHLADPKDKKIASFITSLKWAAIALGLDKLPEGEAFNLRKCALSLDAESIRKAMAKSDAANARFDRSLLSNDSA
jgi:hypothetical protein